MHIPRDTKVSVMPRFITFTGADDHTSLKGMADLSWRYPIEWGLLFSPKQQGTGRYPSIDFITRATSEAHELNFAAHICGGHSRDLVSMGKTSIDANIKGRFSRVQINVGASLLNMHSTGLIALWARKNEVAPILQCREKFPGDMRFSWLFDASGGRGIEPAAWPQPSSDWHASTTLKGYAGGLNPGNVVAHAKTIGEHDFRYWLDMETGVRDENDRFDLARCAAVCEAVYGSKVVYG